MIPKSDLSVSELELNGTTNTYYENMRPNKHKESPKTNLVEPYP
jgi:hypothetical protein